MAARSKRPSDPQKWTAEDFFAESTRVTGDERGQESDDVVCGAMMLAALVHGARLTKVSRAIGIQTDRCEWMFDNLVRNKVFKKDGKVACNWFGEDGGIEFCLDIAVGTGLLARAPAKRKSAKISG